MPNALTQATTRTTPALDDRYSRVGHAFNQLPTIVAQAISTISGYNYYFNDFINYEGATADSASPGTGGWIVTSVDGGADAGEAVGVRAGAQFGVLRITTNDADDDNTQIQLTGSSFKYVAGKRIWCFARIALQTAIDGEVGFGLIEESDVDMVNTFPTDGFFFEKAEAATQFDFHVRTDSVSTENTLVTEVFGDDTFRIIGFVVNADGSITAHDGASSTGVPTDLNSLPVIATVASSNDNIPTSGESEDLTLAFQIQTGSATTRYMDIDWVFVCQER